MPENFAVDKKALRGAMRARRSALSAGDAARLSLAAQRRVLDLKVWQDAGSVALYYAVKGETGTRLLMRAAWKAGKRVFLPHTPGEPKGVMHLLPCSDEGALAAGVFGIPEPDPAACPRPPEGGWVPDLIVTPGLAFDRHGFRVGNGGGYYDRFFARPALAGVFRIGLAYSFQLVEDIGPAPWDRPVNAVATDKELLWI